MTTAEIRQSFTDYFARRDHKVMPSSPVIPFDDPTILFTNAGMNQFKDIFTGRRKADFPRATTVQKCMRAGGKHNDLDNVGFTARHHTFFEMLGNFSFGDYFKEQAINYHWEWVTKELKLPKDRLYATVYESDDEAFTLWEKIAPELKNGRVLRFGKKDNFWSMGDIGPCGPCSEIHFDRGEKYGVGPEHTVNGETDRFIEIGNLVFMQYDQPGDGTMVPLPKPSVDTGSGLERIAAIMQKADTNYQIDLFVHLVRAISDVTKTKYADHPVSQNVIADHIRALTFCLADGAGISNEGRGYVLRRILRRAARHGRQLGMHEPFIYKLVPALVAEMGEAYPEIKEKQNHVQNVIKAEEESFLRTLDTGCQLFDRVADRVKASGSKVVPGEEVFKLYDTYGFPYDLTEIIATEHNLVLDQVGFEKAMQEQQERSRAGASFLSTNASVSAWLEFANRGKPLQPTEPAHEIKLSDEPMSIGTELLTGTTLPDGRVAVALARSPFYSESGGQVSDTGRIYSPSIYIDVKEVEKVNGVLVHVGTFKDSVRNRFASEPVTAEIDSDRRRDIMRNHTATHLAHAALRKVLGEHVKQSGSYVGPEYMRFDFSHHQPMTPEEIRQVEEIVNGDIIAGHPVVTEEMDVDSAKKSGAMALFGEKYGDTVRVVSVPGVSKELCGGTHVQSTGQIGSFVIVAETGIASGVRRIECITGRKATEYLLGLKQFRREIGQTVNRPESEALEGVRQLKDSNAALQKEIKKAKAAMFSGKGGTVGEEIMIGAVTLATNDFGETDK
ncbi:MAG: alanine--tRNA ligase, partial [candidate division Zixibacteria bacterium]|nr:alanine--tRNA ligase [candidate division Zixibacteria bacterium]